MFDINEGNKKVAELDILEAKRVEEIRNTPNMDLSEKKGAKRYVSPSGNDTNCGLTPDAPYRTINRAIAAAVPGDTVLLERGGYWREKVVIQTGITLTAYGEGKKPIISGSPENGAGSEKWTLDYEGANGEKIWKFHNEKMVDVGGIFFDGGNDFSYKGYAAKDIPNCRAGKFTCMGNPEKEYDYRTELKNMYFFHKADSEYNGEYIATDRAVGPLYLRCDKGNPGEIFNQIECVKNGDFTEDEFKSAKEYLIDRYKKYTDSPSTIMHYLYNGEISRKKFSLEERIDNVRKVKREDVIRAFSGIQLDTVYFLKGKDIE